MYNKVRKTTESYDCEKGYKMTEKKMEVQSLKKYYGKKESVFRLWTMSLLVSWEAAGRSGQGSLVKTGNSAGRRTHRGA